MNKKPDLKKNKESIEEVKKENELFKVKMEEYLNGWRRAKADYENLQKQVEQEKESLIKFSNMNLLVSLIPIYQNLQLSFDHLSDDLQNHDWVRGIDFIKNDFKKMLEQNNVEEIVPQVGDEFDPRIHEAVEKNDEKKGAITNIKSNGFKVNGKVFLPAKVVI
jgi:molecular chaperone GrpE